MFVRDHDKVANVHLVQPRKGMKRRRHHRQATRAS
jgi:hypothetical protein